MLASAIAYARDLDEITDRPIRGGQNKDHNHDQNR
jgi:hypothetical protein